MKYLILFLLLIPLAQGIAVSPASIETDGEVVLRVRGEGFEVWTAQISQKSEVRSLKLLSTSDFQLQTVNDWTKVTFELPPGEHEVIIKENNSEIIVPVKVSGKESSVFIGGLIVVIIVSFGLLIYFFTQRFINQASF